MQMRVTLVMLLAVVTAVHGSAVIDWSTFLARSDATWQWTQTTNVPDSWHKSSFVGNGVIGAMLWFPSPNQMHLEISRTDVYDTRQPGSPYALGNFVYDRPRLPIGAWVATVHGGDVINATMRLHLYDAMVTGTVTTPDAAIEWRLVCLSTVDAFIMDVRTLHGDETPVFEWHASQAASTWGHNEPKYVPNQDGHTTVDPTGMIGRYEQSLLGGGSFTTAYQVIDATSKGVPLRRWFITISPITDTGSVDIATKTIATTVANIDQLLVDHTSWWHEYYPASFITMTSTRVESFYWLQMYKIASATRSNGAPYDLQGPWWVDGTSWPDLHFDLNVQLAYSPVYTANRLHLGESLLKMIDRQLPNFVRNVPPEWRNDSAAAPSGASALDGLMSCYWDYGKDCLTQPPTITGNLLWLCQLYHQHYQYTASDESLIAPLYRVLRPAVMFYTHFQYTDATDSRVHLPPTYSPEYPGVRGADTTYDVSLYRWALSTIITIASQYYPTDGALPLWRSTLSRLTNYAVDGNGYMIAAGVPFAVSHRHFSHLMHIFPLATINFTATSSDRQLAERSVDHWIGMTGELTGFCRTAVSSMSTLLNRPSAAYTNITYLIDRYILPNTMYTEGGGPCGETPPALASSIQDMLLFSRRSAATDGVPLIEVFPGVANAAPPDGPGNVAFAQLRTVGGWLISAKWVVNQGTQFVTIQSSSSTPASASRVVRLRVRSFGSSTLPLRIMPSSTPFTVRSDGDIDVTMAASGTGVSVTLYPANVKPPFDIVPDGGTPAEFNSWGVH